MSTYWQEAQRFVQGKLKGRYAYSASGVYDEHLRMIHFKKLYDYYTFNRPAILQYVTDAMKGTFKESTIRKMQFPLYNLTRKIIDRLAVAYLLPAERYIVNSEQDNARYQQALLGSNIHQAAKQWNRESLLFDTVYVGVMFRDGRIDYELFQPHTLHVVEDPKNYLRPIELRYEQDFGGEVYEVVWTPETYEVLDDREKPVKKLMPWGGANEYGRIPFAPCRLRIPENHWGDGDTELVYLNEKLNIEMAAMFFNLLFQSHGQAVAINMNFPGEIETGPDKVLEVNDVQKDDVLPSFEFVHPSPATDDSIRAIDWMIKQAAVMKGLSPASVNTEISDRQSGVAKGWDLAELRERRQDNIEFLRPFEKELFDITRTVWNTNVSGEKISEKAVFGVDFVEPELPVSKLEEMRVKEFKKKFHLWTPLDDMMDEDEGISKEKALEILLENKRINELLGGDDGDTAEPGSGLPEGEGGEEKRGEGEEGAV